VNKDEYIWGKLVPRTSPRKWQRSKSNHLVVVAYFISSVSFI